MFASTLLVGLLAGCGADDVPDEGNQGPDAISPNPTSGGVKQ